ncbi:MAG: carbon-nitrogen hydrolase family protein [candidate division Zixibacteria bacterium]|nr:carbon-nitrogen hydrolase family protein [candidate division Zixibacteria bacterium]MDH3938811.1 carbon-nitrogen hydrolase family protein [candidate division Zixibacteria bacterium]
MKSRPRKIVLAAAQSNSLAGGIDSNVRTHTKFVQAAIEFDCDLILFPELSLTGYEKELAGELAMTPDDVRLSPLREQAQRSAITIVAGAPIAHADGKPYVGAIVFYSDRSFVYTKQHLHHSEDEFFSAGDCAGVVDLNGEFAGLAICADIANPAHADEAAALGASIYAASVFVTPEGYPADAALLRQYAAQHQMAVILSNFAGPTGGLSSAGKSALWDETGHLVVAAPESGEYLVVAERTDAGWNGRVHELPLS